MPPNISGPFNVRTLQHAWWLALFLLAFASAALLPHSAHAAIALGALTSGDYDVGQVENCSGSVCTLTAPTITGPNTVLILAISINADGELLPITATYNGVSLGSAIDGGRIDFTRTAVWVVTNPASAANFVVDFSPSTPKGTAIMAYYTGVDQATPYRTPATGTGASSPASLSATNSESGDTIAGFFSVNDTSVANGFTEARVGADQMYRVTEEWNGETQLAFSDEPGASGTVTHSWTYVDCGANCAWSGVALPLVGVNTSPITLVKPPNNLGLVGYWSFNEGTTTIATDFSGNGKHGTLLTSGGLVPAWANGKRGKALDFTNGGGGYVSLGNTLDISSLPFTASVWIRLDPAGDSFHRTIINKRDTFVAGDMRFHVLLSSDNLIRLDHPTGAVNFTSYTPPFNTWTHITVIATSTGSALYVNGVFTEQGGVYTLGTDAAAQVYIGSNPDFDDFSGDMDELRLYNRALGATEVAALAKAGAVKFTSNSKTLTQGSSLDNGLVGLWTFDGKDTTWTSATAGTTRDGSGNGLTGTITNMSRDSAVAIGKLGQALRFDGSDDRVTITGSGGVANNLTEMTVSAWFKSTYNNSQMIATKENDNVNAPGWRFDMAPTGGATQGKIGFILQQDGSNYNGKYTNATYHDGNWHHAVATLSGGGGGTITLYIDGEAAATTANSAGTVTTYTTSNVILIGDVPNTVSWNGNLDDVRIYSRALTAAEVKQLHKLGTVVVRP